MQVFNLDVERNENMIKKINELTMAIVIVCSQFLKNILQNRWARQLTLCPICV